MSYSGSCRICGMLRHTLEADVCAKCQQYVCMARQITTGSISHGTLNPDHLIPVFEKELERVAPEAMARMKALNEATYMVDPAEYVDELMQALDDKAPEGMYFGNTEGDGSDFGWWWQ